MHRLQCHKHEGNTDIMPWMRLMYNKSVGMFRTCSKDVNELVQGWLNHYRWICNTEILTDMWVMHQQTICQEENMRK